MRKQPKFGKGDKLFAIYKDFDTQWKIYGDIVEIYDVCFDIQGEVFYHSTFCYMPWNEENLFKNLEEAKIECKKRNNEINKKTRKKIKQKIINTINKIQNNIKKGFYLDAYGWIRETREIAKKKLGE